MLPTVFGVALVLALLIYFVGGRTKTYLKTPGKTEPYACGEDLPAEEMKVDMERFLVFTVYFLIFDVLAFVIATSYYTLGLGPVMYALIVLMGVAALFLSRRYR